MIDMKHLPINHQRRNGFDSQFFRFGDSASDFSQMNLLHGRFEAISDCVLGTHANWTTRMIENSFGHLDLTHLS